jgi:hypothetical protein
MNIEEVETYLLTKYNSPDQRSKGRGMEVHVLEVERMSMTQQLKSFSCKATLMIFAHGAGGTTMEFLPRCSTVVEIAPPAMGRFYSDVAWNVGHKYFGYDIPTTADDRWCEAKGKCGKPFQFRLPIKEFDEQILSQAIEYARHSHFETLRCH